MALVAAPSRVAQARHQDLMAATASTAMPR
jgi:hypothetical protein